MLLPTNRTLPSRAGGTGLCEAPIDGIHHASTNNIDASGFLIMVVNAGPGGRELVRENILLGRYGAT
jgi:hypothetical protein